MLRKNIFEVSQDEKRRILGLHESATKRQYLFEGIGDKEILDKLRNSINDMAAEEKVYYMNNASITVKEVWGDDKSDNQYHVVQIGEYEIPIYRLMGKNAYGEDAWSNIFKNSIRQSLEVSTPFTASVFLPELEKNPDYKMLMDKFPTIREQINNWTISGYISPLDNGITFEMWIANDGDISKKDRKRLIPAGQKGYVGNAVIPNEIGFQFQNNIFGAIHMSSFKFNLNTFNFTADLEELVGGPKKVTTGDTFAPITIQMPAGEPFNFDEVTLTKPGEASVNTFIQEVNSLMQKYPKYKPFLESQKEIPVYAYSSGDGDPDANVPAKNDCPASTRKDYDLCLSQKRADFIANKLNEGLGLSVFKGYGKGYENNKVANWTKLKPTKFKDTQPNRRFEVKLPEYTQFFQ